MIFLLAVATVSAMHSDGGDALIAADIEERMDAESDVESYFRNKIERVIDDELSADNPALEARLDKSIDLVTERLHDENDAVIRDAKELENAATSTTTDLATHGERAEPSLRCGRHTHTHPSTHTHTHLPLGERAEPSLRCGRTGGAVVPDHARPQGRMWRLDAG